MKKRMFMLMIIYFFRLIQTNLSHFIFYSIIIFNSPFINCANFFDVNNEPLDLSLKKHNKLKNSMQVTNSYFDLELLYRNKFDIQNNDTNLQFDNPNSVNFRSMNSWQGAQQSSNEMFSKCTHEFSSSVINKTDLNINATENVFNSSNFNPNNPTMLDNKERIINKNMNIDTYKNSEEIPKYSSASITTDTEFFNLASNSKISKQQNNHNRIQEEKINKLQKLASSSISIAKKEKIDISKKCKSKCINKYTKKSNNKNNNTSNGDKYATDVQNLQSETIQNTSKQKLLTKEKNTSKNVSLINKNKSENKHLCKNESSLYTFDSLNEIFSSEKNLHKYFHYYDYNYKFHEIKYNESKIIENIKNTQFDSNIESKEDLYKITDNLIKLIKEECIIKKHKDALDKSLVEQQKIQTDFKNINLKKIKCIIGLIDGIRQFKNLKKHITISSYKQFIKFYSCFVKPLSCLDKNLNYKYLENFCQNFSDSYIFLKNMGNKTFNFLYESKNTDIFYIKNVHKGSLDDLSDFENKINEIFENKNFTKEDQTKALQKKLEDEKLNSQNYVTDIEKLCSDIKFTRFKLNYLRSSIIVLCFILINNILNHNDYLENKISEMIINYIYIYSIIFNIQYFKKNIVSKATRDVFEQFDSCINYLLECKMRGNSKITLQNLQDLKNRIIQNKKRLTIFNYFLDFYIKLFTVINDSSFHNLKTQIEAEFKILISK